MLNPEDAFKLNILIASCVAIRIDVYKLLVIGLTADNQERTLSLNPTIDSDKYIQAVQKLLVNKVLGGMGGYPSYLKRWSRMGQVGSANLKSLLKIGNIEAVVAVANSQNLEGELVEKVWWCATNTDNQAEIGRFLLTRDFVIAHPVGVKIAHYLLEFLPFIVDTVQLIDTVNLVLQGDLIDPQEKEKIWQQGQRKTAFLVGFIERMRGDLPNFDKVVALDSSRKELAYVHSQQGQIFLKTVAHILKKINQEYVLYRTLDALGAALAHPMIRPLPTIEALEIQVQSVSKQLGLAGEQQRQIQARLLLAGASEQLAISTISAHGLAGSAIRKKLTRVLDPIQAALKILTTQN